MKKMILCSLWIVVFLLPIFIQQQAVIEAISEVKIHLYILSATLFSTLVFFKTIKLPSVFHQLPVIKAGQLF